MARNLKLEVVLQAIDRATRPIKAITQGSVGLGRALKESRDQLKVLQAQQGDISSWRAMRTAAKQTEDALGAARERVKTLGQQMQATGVPTRQMTRDLKSAIREATNLKREHQQNQIQLQGMRSKLDAAGISTRNLSTHERDLRTRIEQTNRSMAEQENRLKRVTRQQQSLAKAKQQYERSQQLAGSMAAGGAAGLASGYAIASPLQGIVNAFAPAENAATQLRVSMMESDGSVSADFQKITDLATQLGDRLPGTTADFQEMMTMLRRQGISARSILGGTGEAAAYLGVQLQMGVTAAAEFAAKMQDATRTSEKDMMSLMDTIQRAYYSGVDPTNMLQGFSKISPVMSIINKEGLEAANMLAPLLVMMDQTGMAGESAGNAFRKVFQGAMNNDKIQDVLQGLKASKGISLDLDFTDGKGEFAGIENLYDQLDKLKGLTTQDRLTLIKDLFGDDAETLQVLNTLMSKGVAGYQEVEAKMQAQADLRKRVNEQLATLTNTIEAAQGSWSNAMAEIGAAVAPQLKEIINGLGNVAVRIKDWVKANPGLTTTLFKAAAGLALLLTVGGALSVMIASVLGPFAMVRYGLMLLATQGATAVGALKAIGTVLLWIGRLAMANPIGLLITALVVGAYLIYKNWDAVKAYFASTWAEIQAAFAGGIGGIGALLLNWSPLGLLYKAFATTLSYLGVELPSKFTDFGGMLMDGLVNGISAGLGRVKNAITGAGSATIDWFKQKLGIHSPSRVFAQLGGFTMDGLTQGLAAGESGVLGQIAHTADQLSSNSFGPGGITFDGRPAISKRSSQPVSSAGDTINITINAAPGQDAQALARAVAQELDKRERAKGARQRSALYDQE